MFLPPQPRFRFYNSPANYFLAARDILSGRMMRGDAVERMERRVERMIGAEHAIAMPQGRVAIYMVLAALLKPGQKVIMSPYTLYDVVNMVICAGGRPVFADLEEDTCNISADEVERLIDDETGAVMVTHLHGLVCDVGRIAEICRGRGVPLLEDACQAFGAKIDGQYAGTIGDAGFFSFGRAKNINAFFGGMAVTSRQDIRDAVVERLSDFPKMDRMILLKRIAHCLVGDILTTPLVFSLFTFWLFRHGSLHDVDSVNKQLDTEDNPFMRTEVPPRYAVRMTPLQARLVDAQIDLADGKAAGRLELAEAYHAGLSDIPEVRLPPLRTDGSHIYLSFPIQVADRLALVKYMMRNGRDCVIQHIRNTAELPCFEAYAADCPNAQRTAGQVLLLPTYPGYKRSEAEKNVAVIRRYFRENNIR
ncbi:MAG: DegT/DnrJ/EryC1/StrS family aminotransferase [Alphaproteobacteria bacterium]|jgi:dTDP-4-amino-4,6-dideoxygalactose transaminase|nr:DegT/DnrJ/EryC1/StrS family aminotransferase [Alphaproteobacteria bacterium]